MHTLDEFNKGRADLYEHLDKSKLNGIACPKCGKELVDSCPSITLTSNPPKKHVRCPECKYNGYRIA